VLKLSLNLGDAFSKSISVRIPSVVDLGPLGGVVDFSGAGKLSAEGGATFSLDIGVGLNDPTKFYLYDSSGLTGTLELAGADMAFKAGLGPFSISIVDGQAGISGTLDVSFAATNFDAQGRKLVTLQNIGSVLTDLDVTLAAPVTATLPVYFPTESQHVGDITLNGDLANLANPDPLFVQTEPGDAGLPPENQPPNSDPNDDKIVLDVSGILDGLTSSFENLSLLDQIVFIVDGVDLALGGVQDALDGDIMAFSLPLIGDKLADGADVIGDFRQGFLNDFRTEVEKLANPSENGVRDILFELLSGPDGFLLKTGLDGKALRDAQGKFIPGSLNDIQTYNNLATVSDISQAEIWWKVKIGQNLVDTGADIGLDMGIPGLGLQTDGEIQLNVDWEFDLAFGLSGADGFFIFIDDPNELNLSVAVTLPDASLKGTLGFLEFTAANQDVDGDDNDGNTHLAANFAVNIVNSTDPMDKRLGLSELGRMGFDVLVGAEASAELAMTLGIAGDNGGFPQIQADFFLDWHIDGDPNTAGIQMVSLFDPPPDFDFGRSIQDGLQVVEFRNVSLDVGSYISDVVGPLVRKIQDVTAPVQPIIDIVTTPLPVLSDLGLEITLLDIAKQTGAVDARFIDAVETIAEVISVINSIEIPDDGSLLVPFGSFTVFDRSLPAFTGLSGFDLGSSDFDLDSFASQALNPNGPFGSLIAGLPDGLQDVLGEVSGVAGDILTSLAAETGTKKPFSFPIIENPSQVFGMLMGNPAVLVAYDMEPLKFNAEFSAFFSIFGPLGVSINLEANLTIDFAFGYDTQGFTDFADSDYKNPLLLANGLYVSDDPTNPLYDGTGDDPPELTFDGGLWAAAEVNLGIARGGVGGGIFIGVDFNLFDIDGDGRVRLDELATNFLNQLKAPNEVERLLAPLAVFDVSGTVTAELFAFLKIDFGFYEVDKKFEITPPAVLADFDVNFFRPPVLASQQENGDLLINVGEFAGQRKLGDVSDFGEHIFIEDAGPGKVAVWSDNLEDAGSDAKQIYDVSGRILIYAGDGDDVIDLTGVHAPIPFVIEGGAGHDTIKAGAGGGIIRGGAGDDD
ncbi:MAG: hypothetical protein JJ992_25805, partial [Planctomycetes bacterium]|nr:hypothetical protein [Planctomycetota bacterium]